ncbi:MAG: hypothetical protein JWM09_78 [Francisellaceae bacterium]|nr:hypothetical protein [Francisellaceae bacterium]
MVINWKHLGSRESFLTLLVVACLTYIFRIDIITQIIKIPALMGNKYAQTFVGDWYNQQSKIAKEQANLYWHAAFQSFISELPTSKKIEKPQIEYMIGEYFKWGRGIPKDIGLATYWLEKAKQDGSMNAVQSLKDFEPNHCQ